MSIRMEHTPRPPPPAVLERIGRYRIVRPLSKGGMALVYEARRESLAGVSPRVAIKLILPEYTASDTFRDLFINEARLGASMHHQNLVQIQDFDQDGDRFFLVMEYVEGITLRRAISLCRRNAIHVPLGVIAEIGRQACDGLAYAHAAKDESGQHLELVHRDVKPSNLILNPQGVVKLVDFGISKGRRLAEKKGTVKGTWGYMAPEQAAGREVGPGTDVFGLAVVLYELASKRPLFPDKTPDTVKRLLADDHAARMAATLDPRYRDLVGPLVRALQRDPAARYQSASEFGRALSALLPDPISARDEVVRFYEGIDALHRGVPVPVGTLATDSSVASVSGGRAGAALRLRDDSSASSIGRRRPEDDGLPVGLIVAGVVGVGLLLLLGAGGAVAWFLSGAPEPPDAPTVASALPQVVASSDDHGGVSEPVPEPEPPPPADAGPPPSRPVQGRPPPAVTIPVDLPGETGPASGTAVASETAAASADPEEDAGVADASRPRVVVVRRAPEPEPASPAAAPEATGPGFLTIGARQAAEVYIDGRFVRRVPLVRYELEPGPHTVVIQALDGRKKTFEVDVAPDEVIRRVWDFDRAEWRP